MKIFVAGVGVFTIITFVVFVFLHVSIRDQCLAQSVSAAGTGLCLRKLSDVATVQGPLLLPWWQVGWDPCGKESPCK